MLQSQNMDDYDSCVHKQEASTFFSATKKKVYEKNKYILY